MRPNNLKTKIFLDSGDPAETKKVLELLGFLDGQTTNPSLVSKNPHVVERLDSGKKFTKEEIYDFYKTVVQKIAILLPRGSVSVEVYADNTTDVDTMFAEGQRMFSWIPNAHIKFPTTHKGLKAAQKAVAAHMRINMTLCFTLGQSAAVYSATRGAPRESVFVSPFVGRLDDRGENGMDYVKNTLKLYEKGDGHVEVLTASVRSLEHFLYAIALGSDIISAPFRILDEWAARGMTVPGSDFVYKAEGLVPIPYENFDLNAPWDSFDIADPLVEAGISKFSDDWNKLIQ